MRGAKVFAWTKRFLDEIAPLAKGSHAKVRGYAVQDGRLVVSFDSVADTWLDQAARLIGLSSATKLIELADPAQFVGYRGDPSEPRAILLRHHGLHIEILIDTGTTSARTTLPASPTSCSRPPSPPSWTGRFGRRRRCRGQGRASIATGSA